MNRFRYALGSGLLLVAALGQSSQAADIPVPDELPVVPVVDVADYGLFGLSGEATYFDFDVANGFTSTINESGFLFIRQAEDGFEFDEWGGGGNVHVKAPLSGAPLGGASFHVVVGGSAASDEEDDVIGLEGGEFLDVLPLNGDPSPGAIAAGDIDTDTDTDLHSEVDFFRVYGAPTLGWGAGNVTFNFGPMAEYKEYDLEVDFDPVDNDLFLTLDERVEVWSAGPMAAVMGRMPLGTNLEAFLGGQGSVLYAAGDLEAFQTASNLPDDGISVSDDEEDVAFFGRVTGGLSLTAGRFVGSIYGAAEWRNDMYEIVNPRSGPGIDADDAATEPFEAAHLDQTGMVAVSVGLRGAIRFGGAAE